MRYNHRQIEKRWQILWEKEKTFRTEKESTKPKYYILDMFPYPSGKGLHVGHPLGYTATDILARFKRLNGFNVLHPMGWDAFGLPAEQHAIKTGAHPSKTTRNNIDNFRNQIKRLGFSYDWDREVNTTDPQYYKWTQWIFVQLYKKGLAYEAEKPVNWCPQLGTVLANEEVIDGKSEVGGFPVVRKPMRQWMLKITDYAESLLKGLDDLDWPLHIKELQRNWIGKSIGAEVDFPISGINEKLRVFTTRPDTLFGATYMVISPEYPLVDKLTIPENKKQVNDYVITASTKSDLDRTELNKEKTGVFLGSYALNPVTEEKIPIWISDYVLISYGTGAIMAVPGHDQRDWEFAKKFGLLIKEVVSGGDIRISAYTDNKGGKIINSQTPDGRFSINGLSVPHAVKKISQWLESEKIGKKTVQYKLRDWLFSRQRYWGEPIPLVHYANRVEVLAEEDLPLTLPECQDYLPSETGEPPLSKISEWVEFTHPKTGEKGLRETNTMPQWAGSCWYYLRYLDPQNGAMPWDKDIEKYWMPVDLYVGGQEHAVLHLLYARFWHHVLFDLGLVSTKEPFSKLFNQGMVLGEDNAKMSKSKGNVVNPDDIIKDYGADSMRLYEMFMGPLGKDKPWSNQGVQGCSRFINKFWNLITGKSITNDKPDKETMILFHKTIKKVTQDLENMDFNTAISQLMIFVNHLTSYDQLNKDIVQAFLILTNPFAPHVTEELNQIILKSSKNITDMEWPGYDDELTKDEQITIAIQINGKLRSSIIVSADTDEDELLELAKQNSGVDKYLQNKTVRKEIYVPGRLINFVIS